MGTSAGEEARRRAPRAALTATVLLLTMGAPLAMAQSTTGQEQGKEFDFEVAPDSLGDALTTFGMQSGLQVSFAPELVEGKRSVGLSGRFTATAGLDALLRETGLEYGFINGSTVVIRRAQPPSATVTTANGTLTGRVTQAGEPVAGATVTATSAALDESRVVTTDDDGNYELTALPPGKYSLRFELEGLDRVVKEVRVSPGKTTSLKVEMSLHEVREDIVVTGSRIRRAEVEGPSPVIFLTREDLDRSGRATVGEALATLPQNFASPIVQGSAASTFTTPVQQVDLRGLGADNTLVLVNGRRVANTAISAGGIAALGVDLNSIPLAAVERIEVLTDGASALYGSDAVAGVVNIILKQDFTGADVSVNYGASVEGGAPERRVSFTTGGAKGGWRGLLNGDYQNRTRLAFTDRAFSRSDDQRARGGRDFRGTFANPGNIFSLDGHNLPGLDAPFAGIPAGQDGRNLTPADFATNAGQLNLQDQNVFSDLIPPSERWGLNGRLDRELGSRLTLFAEAGVTHTTGEFNFTPPVIFTTVPASNPFNPFGVDVQVQWLASELGSSTNKSETDNLLTLAGLEGRVGRSGAWETSFSYSRDEQDLTTRAFPNVTVVTDLLSRTDPTIALNVFGDGPGANSPEVLAELGFARLTSNFVADLLNWEGRLDGVLAEWAGRELRAAAGLEYREESIESTTLAFFVDPSAPSSTDTRTRDRELAAGYVELSLPLFGPGHKIRGVRVLELQLAGRYESYSDFGETFNPKFALRWQPIESLALRASWGTGFRAPSLTELTPDDDNPVLQFPAFDPQRNESVIVDLLGATGGKPDLDPEESESWNLGLVWDVPLVRGLSLTADIYDLRQDDQITSIFVDELLDAEALFPERVMRAEPTPEDLAVGLPGRILALDISLLNISTARVRGVDWGFNYLKDTAVGAFDLRFQGAYIDRLTRQLTPVAPIEQVAGNTSEGLASFGSPARLRSNLSLFWSRGAWEVGVTERYSGHVRELNTISPTFGQFIDDHYETDLQLNYRWPGTRGPLADVRISLGVENLFNAEPPFRDARTGFYSRLHSPRQAFPYLTLTKSF